VDILYTLYTSLHVFSGVYSITYLKLIIMMFVKDIRPLQYGKIHEVLRIDDDKIVTTTGIVLYSSQYELID